VIRFARACLLIIAANVCGLCQSLDAAAAYTPIYDAHHLDEPSLIGVNPFPGHISPSVLETLYGEANLRRVDDRYDIAFRHSGVEATVTIVAHFGGRGGMALFFLPNRQPLVLNPNLITSFVAPSVGGYRPAVPAGVIPLAESGLVFGLQANSSGFSDPALNQFAFDRLVTFEVIGNVGRPDNVVGNYVLAWDLPTNRDGDYQDVVYEISGARPIPEPSSCLSLATAILAFLRVRRPLRRPGTGTPPPEI
jgi:hypothetical protein